MLRCASWEAVSSKRQAAKDKVSLERQHDTNVEAIQKIGGRLVATLLVPGQSRSIVLFEDACRKVDAYRQLRELVDTRAIDVLVCYTHSRLGREISLCESVVAYCLAGGVAIYDCTNPPLSLDATEQARNAGARLMSVIRSWESQAEVQRLRQNSADGIDKSVKLGNFPPGPKPKFWTIEYSPSGERTYKINEGEASRAKEVIRLYLSGLGAPAIVERTGLTVQAIYHIVDSAKTLAGYVTITRNGKAITARGKQPAIIDDDTMNRLLVAKEERGIENKGPKSTYVYSRLILCEKCNVNMSVNYMMGQVRKDGTRNTQPALMCPKCFRWVRFVTIDTALQLWLQDLYGNKFEAIPPSQVDSNQQRVDALNDEFTRIAKEKSRLITLYTSELIELTDYKTRLTQYQQRETTINNELQQLSTQSEESRHRQENLDNVVALLRDELQQLSTEEVNTIYRKCLHIVYTVDKKVDIQFRV